ncbi:hypothetical protein CV102_22290 [Natronococcus pandeyae]|uniref:Uncharacterized protein n=1 Tax=Natronococcus pandeyae TaxID=2055836 RepID=A0A8J8TQH9_9EURY|nr:hypothetical protein [Natronococcus pandeyae]TYL36547.1 hypothetical protein CV102_22290 [Natronococcus pandeyae]
MSNPFDDLESDDDDDRTEDETDEGERSSSPNATEPDVMQEAPASSPNRQSRSGTAGEQRSREPTPADSGPAFEYSTVRQRPLYARSETWDDFEKTLRTSITPSLAKEDVVDEETREIHDAVLRLAASEPERVAKLVLEARRQSE